MIFDELADVKDIRTNKETFKVDAGVEGWTTNAVPDADVLQMIATTRARSISRAMCYIKASCHGGGVPMVLRASAEPIAFDPKISLTDAVGLSLVTSDGKSLGCAKVATRETANDIMDAVGKDPSSIMQTADGRIALVWLFTSPQEAEKVSATLRLFTGYAVDDQLVPLPGCDADYAFPKDEPEADASFTAYDADDLLRRIAAYAEASAEEVTSDVRADAGMAFDPSRWPNVELIGGDFDPAVLAIPMAIAMPKDRKDERIRNFGGTFGTFLDRLCHHEEGEKDGLAFLQGELNVDRRKGGQRKKGSMLRMHLVGLDIDTGAEIDPIIDKARELGLACVVYTSASHMSTVSTFLVDQMWEYALKHGIRLDAPEEIIRHYVTHEKKWEPRIIETIHYIKQRHEPQQDMDGPVHVIAHDHMPKHRFVFPLSSPVSFNIIGKRPQDIRKEWGQKLLALAAKIGAPIDTACLDVARLFYLGRHKKDAPFRVVVVNGKPLDYDAIEIPADEKAASDPFAAAGRDMGAGASFGSKGAGTFKDGAVAGFSFTNWARLRGHRIDFTRLLIDKLAPEQIRNEISEDQIEIECPFDSGHSNAGNPEDRACCVWNADPSQKKGFSISCRHASCQPNGKDRDRLEFVCEMVTSGWLTIDDLENDEYILDLRDGETIPSAKTMNPKDALKDILQRCDELGDAATYDEREALLREAVQKGVTKADINKLKARLESKKHKFTPRIMGDLIREVLAEKRAERVKDKDEDGRVVIGAGEHHSKAIGKAVTALVAHNAKDPHVFQSGGSLVRLYHDKQVDTAQLQELSANTLPHVLRQAVAFCSTGDDAREIVAPKEIVADILADLDTGLPGVTGIVRTPFFARGQDNRLTLVSTPGYHAASGYYYAPTKGFEMKPIPSNPTADDIAHAKDLLFGNVLVDFPFSDEATGGRASRTHALCMLLQPFMREAIAGPTPIYFVTKPMPGTGGGLLIDSTMLIATGREGEAQTHAKSEDETRKNITATFRSGSSVLWIDNIHGTLDSAAYASLATSEWWTDRILGESRKGCYANKVMVVFVGNNVSASHEITRRLLPIFLDAKGDPLKRGGFKHIDLKAWVRENRSDLVWACLTLIQAWVAAGEPKDQSNPLPSFEAYSATFRGLMRTIGEDGFLGNLDQVHAAANEESDAWGTFVSLWAERFGMGPQNVRTVGDPDLADGGLNPQWTGGNSLVTLIEQAGISIPMAGHTGIGKAKSLSALLRGKADNVFDVVIGGSALEVTLRRDKIAALNAVGFWLDPVARTVH